MDYSRTKFSDISRSDLKGLLNDKIKELHLDCSQKPDETIIAHTATKMLSLMQSKYRSWYWGDFTAVCNQGICGGYGGISSIVRINFQTLATWMKKAAHVRTEADVNRQIAENNQHKKEDIKCDYKAAGRNWGPVIQVKLQYGYDFKNPDGLKKAIANNEVPPLALDFLRKEYPYTNTVGYPEKISL